MRTHLLYVTFLLALFTSGCGYIHFDIELPLTFDTSPSGSPDSIPLLNIYGGDEITVSGRHLNMETSLLFGERECASKVLVADDQLRCTTPSFDTIGKLNISLTYQGRSISDTTKESATYGIIGQDIETAQASSGFGIRDPFYGKMCGSKFVIADINNHRLVVYNSMPTSGATPFDYVIGQPNRYSKLANAGGSANARTLNLPFRFECYQNKLIVADSNNKRILIWNQFPQTENIAADVVLGQPDFTTTTVHNGGVTAQSLSEIPDLTVDKYGRLYAVDTDGSHRVLVWDSIPTVNFAPANHVIGAPDFTTATGAATQSRTQSPFGILAIEDRFFLSDGGHRILVWNTLPSGMGQPADLVLGQTTFTNSTSGTSDIKFKRPFHLATDGIRLAAVDNQNNRVLIWNDIPVVSNDPADIVIGQQTMTTGTANFMGRSAYSLSNPNGVTFIKDGANTKLVISDTGNHRLLVWNNVPSSSYVAADYVIGQESFTNGSSNWNPNLTSMILNKPEGAFYDGQHFVIADTANHRVLIWNGLPKSKHTEPDVILGQSNFTSKLANAGGTVSANTLNGPNAVIIHDGKLYVADGANSRVLIWDAMPTGHFQGATRVLGQPNFTTGTVNSGVTPSASTMRNPSALTIQGTRLYVADSGNNRILYWDAIPTMSSVPATGVLGQSNFSNVGVNQGGLSGATLSNPRGLASNADTLVVADRANNRILIWKGTPTMSSAATFILGQPSDITSTSNNVAGLPAQYLKSPISASISGNSLYVSDRGNNRVLKYDLGTLATHSSAVEVLGQPDFATFSVSGGTLYGLAEPEAVVKFEGGLLVTDKSNQRILLWPDLP